MKTVLSLTLLSLFLIGCGVNPNKEARIQKLETELQVSAETIHTLETEVKNLQRENADLLVRVKALEKQ